MLVAVLSSGGFIPWTAAPRAWSQEAADSQETLRFNFSRQPWEEVLRWLAEQADLSLVLDSPPPGSFNYSDDKAYTPAEAIDLVNGVLGAKGYTLLRRERMLMLVNLQEGVPRSLIPRVAPTELAGRGRNEFATVAFPLSGRNLEAVVAEVKPLLSEYGEASPLPASGQVQITDRAGVLQTIMELVEAIPAPSSPAPPSPPGTPAPLEFRAYELEGADGATATEMLETIIDGKIAHDPVANRINVHATAAAHQVVDQIIKQLQGDATARKFRYEIYPIGILTPTRQTQLLADLERVASNAHVRFDADQGQLVIWATEEQHPEVRKTLFTLLAAGAAQVDRSLKVYVFRHVSVSTMLDVMQSATPNAQIKPAGAPDRLLVIGSKHDQRLLAELVAQLDTPPRDEKLQWREYPLMEDAPAELSELLATAAPKARVRVDADRRTVAVTATDEDQQTIADTLLQLQKHRLPAEDRRLQIYALNDAQQERFEQVQPTINEIAPAATVKWTSGSREVFVWASPERHVEIQRLLDSIGSAPPPKPTHTLKIYPASTNQLSALHTMATTVAPDAVATIDLAGRRLLIWAKQEDHERLKSLFASEGATGSAARAPRQFRSHSVGGIDATVAVGILSERFPGASFQSDTTARSIVAEATPDEHEQIAQLIEQLQKGSSSLPYQVEVYPLGDATTAQASSLASLFPTLRIQVDETTRQVSVMGDGETQQQFAETLASLGGNKTTGGWQVRVFPLERAAAAEVAAAITGSLPGVTASAVNNHQLLLRFQESHANQIQQLVAQLDRPDGDYDRQAAEVFLLKRAAPDGLAASLRVLFPAATGASFSVDPQTNSILAVADRRQMNVVREVVEAADGSGDNAESRVLEVHPLSGVDARAAVSALERLFKDRGANPELSIDDGRNRLVVVASPEEHKVISDVLETLAPQETILEVFALQTMEPFSAELAIGQLFDDESTADGSVEIESDDQGGRIFVRAPQSQLDEIRKLLVKMGEVHLLDSNQGADAAGSMAPRTASTPGGPRDFSVYPLQNAAADRIAKVLNRLYGSYGASGERINFAADERINAVVVKGGRSDRREVEALLQTLDTNQPVDFFKPNQPRIITLKHVGAMRVYEQLTTLYRSELRRGDRQPPIEIPPGADPQVVATLEQINAAREGPLLSLDVDETANQIVMIAPQPLQQEILDFIEKIDQPDVAARVGVRVIPLKNLQGDEVLQSLKKIMSE